MFGFGKKKQEKKENHLDKVVMGMIVGGAIGSVLGLGLAPKKGADTRKYLGKQAGKMLRGARDVIQDAAQKTQQPDHKGNLSRDPRLSATRSFGTRSIPDEK